MANPAPDSAGKGLDVSHSTGLHTQDAGDVEVEALCAGTGTANTIQPSLSWEGLRVMESHLPGAGKGLFAASAFRCGDILCEYKSVHGGLIPTRKAIRLEDKGYLMRLGPQAYIDLRQEMSVAARYINDCRNPRHFNVTFEKRPEEGRALVVAIRDLKEGDELYVDYGKWYWAGCKEKPARLD